MSRYHSYLNSAEKAIRQYDGAVPLSVHLKQFFAGNKQMGSRDRKAITQLCYQVFRLGHWQKESPVYERIIEAALLFENENRDFLQAVAPDHVSQLAGRNSEDLAKDIFPFHALLSSGVDETAFGASFLQQPNLFLRIRPGCEPQVTTALVNAQVRWEIVQGNCIQLVNTTKVADILRVNKWVVVQDYSSQQTGEIMARFIKPSEIQSLKVWDACAASGGKSIMIYDLFEDISLTVSDIRESILENLKSRFLEAGIGQYKSFSADLTKPQPLLPGEPFDLVIADVPCTGSGTWARTPEELYFFEREEINRFASRQTTIAKECARHVKAGGWMAYITCSVFAAENENVVSGLLSEGEMQLVHDQIIPGWPKGADTMYIALMKKTI